MNIQIVDGLPVLKIKVRHNNKEKILNNVLLDTGSSSTILDVDAVEDIDLVIDPVKGQAIRMFGVGGESELCYEQKIANLVIEDYRLNEFRIQLGITKENYGFDGIIGVDFLIKNNIIIDFSCLTVR